MAWGGAVTERTTCKQGHDIQPGLMERAAVSLLGTSDYPRFVLWLVGAILTVMFAVVLRTVVDVMVWAMTGV